jgi:hypothetical protein
MSEKTRWHEVEVLFTDGGERFHCVGATVRQSAAGWLVVTLTEHRGEYEWPPERVRQVRKFGREP